MPFLLPNQQHQSTEGLIHTKTYIGHQLHWIQRVAKYATKLQEKFCITAWYVVTLHRAYYRNQHVTKFDVGNYRYNQRALRECTLPPELNTPCTSW